MFVFYIKKQLHTLLSHVTLFSVVGDDDTTPILVSLSVVNKKLSWWSDLQ